MSTNDRILYSQAIITRYLGPTNTKGARIVATAYGGRLTLPRKYNLEAPEDHKRVARAFADKMGWGGSLVGAALPDDTGYCWMILGEGG